MIKNLIYILIFIFTIPNFSFSAATSSSGTKSSYDQAVKLIKAAKKYDKKGKSDKAQKRFKKALELLLKSNQEKPLQADTLNYLGFATRKLGDYENGEKYYLLGLKIDPNHRGINEYLGELYIATNRIDLAKERLEVLKTCNCEEYTELKGTIEGTKKSKY